MGGPKGNFIVASYRSTISYLTRIQKWKLAGILLLSLINGFVDIIGLASILPVVSLALKPELINEHQFIYRVYSYFGFTSINAFVMALFFVSFFLIILRNLFAIYTSYQQEHFSATVSNRFSMLQLQYYLQQNLQYINSENSATFIRNVTVIPQHFSKFILMSQLMMISELIAIALIMVGIVAFDAILFMCLVVVLVPMSLLFYSLSKRKIREYGIEQNRLYPVLYSQVHQAIDGYVDVKLLGKESFFLSRYTLNLDKVKKIEVNMNVIQGMSGKVIEVIAFVGVMILLMYAMFFADDRAYFLSLIGLFVAATYRLIPTYNRILHSIIKLRNHSYIFDMYAQMESYFKTPDHPFTDAEIPLEFDCDITFREVSYTYPLATNPVFDNINLTIPKGQKVGFIGKSGSGKTTLVNILLRFLKEDRGQILIDGIPLDDRHLREWRKRIGYVQQNVFIIEGTVAENIAFGQDAEEMDMQRIEAVLAMVKLDTLVNTLPDGLHSRLREHGANMSGGQRQRIAIARALYQNAEIFIFDEATSALDNDTEEEINESIAALGQQNKTVIVIAHRYTSLKSCDIIYELEGGKIINTYTYQSLISAKMKEHS